MEVDVEEGKVDEELGKVDKKTDKHRKNDDLAVIVRYAHEIIN